MKKIRGNKWNRRICKWIASLLTVALLVNQSSLSVLAEEIGEVVCQCDIRCSADSVNGGCPVCAQDYGRCEGAEVVTDTDTGEGTENPDTGEAVDTDTGEETENPGEGEGDTDADTETVPDTDTDEETEEPGADESDTDADEEIVSDVDAEDEEDALLQEEVARNVNGEDAISPAAVGGNFAVDGILYEIISEDAGNLQVEVEKWLYGSGDVEIPIMVSHEADDYKVVRIGARAFEYGRDLTNITIAGSVASIENSAFLECNNLTSVTILEGDISIGDQAFKECNNLTSITILGSVSNIGDDAFEYCSSLESIAISGSVTSIGSSAFLGCSSLESVTLPDSVTSIGSGAFGGCSSLAYFTMPSNITNIGSDAFGDCSSLASITIPDSVTSIEDYVFVRCSNLASVTIPDSVTSIGDSAFSGCSSLTSVTIPDRVTSIGDSAFADCSSLASITIPGNVVSIGTDTFLRCRSLESATIPDSVTSIGVRAFDGCSSLKSITIPDSVTSIGRSAFSSCSSLINIIIPDKVTSIEEQTFYGCSSLASITIPGNVTSIGESAFGYCSGLKSITIIDGITSIGGCAFEYCSSVESIIIPKSVIRIEGLAFWHCSNLTNVTVLNESIDLSFCFNECSNLNNLKIAIKADIAETPNIMSGCFFRCPEDRYLTFLTEDGTTELSETTTPKLSKAIEVYDAADGIDNDGMWYGWKLTKAPAATTYSVTIKANKDGGTWNDCEKTFALSTDGINFTTNFTAVPAGTYTIYDTTGATDSADYDNTYVTVNVTDAAVDATVNYYTVTFYDGDTPLGEPQIVLNNTTVSGPSESPTKDGYTFYRWVTSKGGSTEFDFINTKITAKTDIYASWTKEDEKTFTITASAGTGGSISPSGAVTVISGDDQQFTITPDDGYRVSSVLVDGVEQLSSTQAINHARAGISDAGNNAKSYTFENVTDNHTLTAAFTAISTGGDIGGGGSDDNGDDDDPNDNNGGGGSGGGGSTGGGGGTGGGSGGGGDTGGGSDGSGGGDTEGGGSGGSDNSGGDSTDGSRGPARSGNGARATVSDTSVKNGVNANNVRSTAPASKDSEPKTGDASHMEIYATIAMIAGLSYLLLYFADGKNGMTEEEKKEIVAALVTWAKNGSSVKKYAALAVIFLILVYYHSIGKRTTVDWKEVYER